MVVLMLNQLGVSGRQLSQPLKHIKTILESKNNQDKFTWSQSYILEVNQLGSMRNLELSKKKLGILHFLATVGEFNCLSRNLGIPYHPANPCIT